MAEGHSAITSAIEAANGPAICAYLTAGYPTKDRFGQILSEVAEAADVIEVGVPFSDPMADGQTIQSASHIALENGVTLGWILETVASLDLRVPYLLMGYYNPFLAYGLERTVADLAAAGGGGVIVPDLPLEESTDFRSSLDAAGLGLVQLVSPTTPNDRLSKLAEASRGFVYAVSTTGVTGGATSFDPDVLDYLDSVSASSRLPVMAGFGIRERSQVSQLAGHVDGVVIGSALIDSIDSGSDPAGLIHSLRGEA